MLKSGSLRLISSAMPVMAADSPSSTIPRPRGPKIRVSTSISPRYTPARSANDGRKISRLKSHFPEAASTFAMLRDGMFSCPVFSTIREATKDMGESDRISALVQFRSRWTSYSSRPHPPFEDNPVGSSSACQQPGRVYQRYVGQVARVGYVECKPPEGTVISCST